MFDVTNLGDDLYLCSVLDGCSRYIVAWDK